MAPLVFKTSLGVVRLPEGSTPSLLRQLVVRARGFDPSMKLRALSGSTELAEVKVEWCFVFDGEHE